MDECLRLAWRGHSLQIRLRRRFHERRVRYGGLRSDNARRRLGNRAVRKIEVERYVGQFEFEVLDVEARLDFRFRHPVFGDLRRCFRTHLGRTFRRHALRDDRRACGSRACDSGLDGRCGKSPLLRNAA